MNVDDTVELLQKIVATFNAISINWRAHASN